MTQQAKNVRSSSSDKSISVQVNPSPPPPFSSFPPIISPQPRVRLPFLLALHSSGENLARKPSEPLPITHITSQSLLDTALFRNISIFTSAQNWLSLKKLLEQRNIFDLHEPPSHKPILQSCFLWPPFYWWYSKQWYWYRTQIYSKIGIRTDMCWYMLLQSPKSTQELVWMFGLEPICELWIALKLRGLGATQLVVTALRPRPLAALSDRRPSRIVESSCAVMTIENIADTSFPQTRPKE